MDSKYNFDYDKKTWDILDKYFDYVPSIKNDKTRLVKHQIDQFPQQLLQPIFS